jgi:hypothetical protein
LVTGLFDMLKRHAHEVKEAEDKIKKSHFFNQAATGSMS